MYVNAPRYLLRKYCIQKLIKDIPRGSVLEIGCGAGDLCETLFNLGFKVKGIDFSQEAIEFCRQRIKKYPPSDRLQFLLSDINQLNETFDAIMMFEVLEHIKDDQQTLQRVREHLNPGGYLLLSVPANQRWFGPSDRYAGHYRRYNKKDLIKILEDQQFKVEVIWAYGVPLANITEHLRNWLVASKTTYDNKEEATKSSGIKRDVEARFRFFFNDFFLYPFYLTQMVFLSTQLGTGYIVKAKRT
ncbi:MAG: class I SAM-dependent methyltransferase [Candidatus Omnitrophota bacterium]|nr:class I SAM-dependent methyltransferase [Candidatus Omnitrophota bacterium]